MASSVHLHGWKSVEDGGTEYTDDPKEIDGWCVYIRTETPNDPEQSFDISNEIDFADLPSAKDYAEGFAHNLFGDKDQFEHY